MRKRHILLYIVAILLGLITIDNNVSALSYSTDVNIGFTFSPTISVSISPNNLIIPNLTPGTATDSNPITVNVSTNTAYGYHLTANVGNNTDNYNTTNLVHTTSSTSIPTTNATFASLAYGANITNKDNLPTNTWGYSYSNDSGTTWQSYSGLPLYSDTEHSAELISTYNPANSKSIDFKIAANANNTQSSGEYTNIINFYAVSNPEPPTLYDTVRYMAKGTLAENDIRPSSVVTQANSGVYTYDPTVYGVASDASNDYPIYFYRGILDTDAGLGTYGSDGKADAWPNYVKLSNGTCWRIVRTTGSGGVKMIYNGTYKNGTCANTAADAQITTKAFNANNTIDSRSIVAVGYTFNSNYKITTEDTTYGALFGTNDSYSGNGTDSTIKDYLENTWFTSVMNSYEDKLEPSAGYCNDRSIYNTTGDLLTNNDEIIMPYASSGSAVAYDFGSRKRIDINSNIGRPSLSCPRDIVDLYTMSIANDGNGQLSKPIALLTADEALFAVGTATNTKPYLASGNNFWLLSASSRGSSGYVDVRYLYGAGYIGGHIAYLGFGVRPVISLMHHIQVTGGTGTSTSPWTIE